MGNAGVDMVEEIAMARKIEREVEPFAGGRRQLEGNERGGMDNRGEDADGGLDAQAGRGAFLEVGEGGKAASAVPAHRGGRAIGIEEDHADIGGIEIGRGAQKDESVGTDAGMAGAEGGDVRRKRGKRGRGIIDEDEVVSGPVVLGEGESGGGGVERGEFHAVRLRLE